MYHSIGDGAFKKMIEEALTLIISRSYCIFPALLFVYLKDLQEKSAERP